MKRLLAALLVGVSGLSARAVDGSWVVDADGNWSAGGNWDGSVVAGGVSGRAFFTNAISLPRVVSQDVVSNVVGHLYFDSFPAAGWSLVGQSLALGVNAGSPTVSVVNGSAAVSVRLTGTQGLVKAGSGSLSLSESSTFTGTTFVTGGSVALTGAVLNSRVDLAAGTMLSAQMGQGLVGEYYFVTPANTNNANPNFETENKLETYLSTLSPNLLFNGPTSGTNFDFGTVGSGANTNFPPGTPVANFQTRWKGVFNAPVDGTYYFGLSSDDGSMVWIDGVVACTNNAFQGYTAAKQGFINLLTGPHEIVVGYYEGTGGWGLSVDMALPGGTTNRLPLASLQTGPAIGSLTGAVGSVLDLSNAPIIVAQSSDGNFDGTLAGAFPLRKVGAARLTLTADNSAFTGGLVLEGGAVSIAGDSNIGSPSSPITFAGGTLRMFNGAPANLDSHAVNWGTFNGALDVALSGHVFTVSGAMGGSGVLTKLGAGTLVLAETNTIAGATVNSGVVQVAASGSLDGARVVVGSGTMLLLESANALTTNTSLSLQTGVAGFGRVNLTNGVNVAAGSLTLNGVLQKVGTYGATGSGAQFINDNYFTGSGILTVTAGIISQNGSWGVNASGDWGVPANWVNGGVAFGTNSTALFTNTITGDRTVNNGYSPLEIGNLTFAPTSTFNWFVTNGSMELAVAAGLAPTITVSSNNATVSSTTLGSQGLLKTGAGQLILTGQGLYSGTTTVSQGTLNLTGSGTLYNAGTLPGSIELASGSKLVLNRSDVLGTHTNVPSAPLSAGPGALIFNTGAVFNTFNNLSLIGAELRANGGANTNFPAYQLKGTVTVSGASASTISATRILNAQNQIQLGNNQPNGTTEINVADVTGDAGADLVVSAGFANGRNAASSAFVPSGFVKTGPGKILLSGSSIITGPSSVSGGEVVVSGGVVNAAVALSAGTMLTAEVGPGLVGEFYNTGNGTNPLSASFNTLQHFANHLANVTPTMAMLYNGPNNSTNFDFTGGGWPQGLQNLYLEGRWAGKFVAAVPGVYSFYTASDDGSMIWVNGTNVVNNNAFQGTTTRTGTVFLAAGEHDIVIAYYQGGGGITMNASVKLPGSIVTNLLPLAYLLTAPAIGGLSGAAGSVVNVSNAPITIGQMSDGTFSGSIVGTNTVRKTGHGILTLDADNSSFPGVLELGGGRVAISAANQLPLNPLFNGGVLSVTGTGLTVPPTPHAINWSTFIGGFDVADPANVFTITNSIGTATGLSSFWKFGPGELPLVGSSNYFNLSLTAYTGVLRLAQSHTTVNGGLSVGRGGTLLVTNAYLASLSNITDSIGGTVGDQAALMVLAGTGMFFKTQNNFIAGNAANADGTLVLKDSSLFFASGSSLFFGNGTAKGILTVGDSATLRTTGGSFMLANSVGSTGIFYQSGGSLALVSDFNVGRNAGGYGFRNFSGGSYTNSGNTQVGGGGVGLLYQSGGLHAQTGSGIYIGNNVGGSGTGVMWVSGGIVTSTVNMVVAHAVNGRGEFTLSGGTVQLPTVVLNNNTNIVAVFNLNGGLLQANAIVKNFQNSTNVVNLNGGTLQARANGNLLGAGTNAPDNIYVRTGGVTFDSGISGAFIVPNLIAPPGDGLSSIPVLTGGSGYLGAPYVRIADASGTGATAVAQVDLVAGTVTNILITSPGVNYSATPSVTLVGGAFASAATLGVPTVAANGSGGVNITGSGSIALLGTNTYSGATTISNGILLVNSTNTIAGALILATNTAGIGPTYPLDQSFIDWLTGKVDTAAGGILALGTNSAANLDLTGLNNWQLGAAGGSQVFSGSIALPSTNVYLGGSGGNLIYQPNLVSGSNYFIGLPGGSPAGIVTFSGTNDTYASGSIVRSGTLRGGRVNAFGASNSTIVIEDGATLDVFGQNHNEVQVFVRGRGVFSLGAIVNSGAAAAPALRYVTLQGDTTFGNPSRWDIRHTATGPRLDLAGFTLTKTGATEVVVFNCEVTDGSIIIDQGMFRFEVASTATSGVGSITINPSGNLDFWGFVGNVDRPIVHNGGNLSVGSGTANIGSPVALNAATNTITAAAGTTFFTTNSISGAGVLRKMGLGTVKSLGTLAHTGPTHINLGVFELAGDEPVNGHLANSSEIIIRNGGTLRLDYDGNLFGTNARPITIGNGGFLSTSNGVGYTLREALTLAGGTITGGTPHATFGNWVLQTNIPVTALSSITAPRTQLGLPQGVEFNVGAGGLTVSGTLESPSGSTGALIKTGSGVMTITSTNTYSGDTIVAAGTLRLGAFAPAGGASIWLDSADDSTITRDGSGFISQWSDKSGHARHAIQTTNSAKPTFVTNTLLNKTAVRFSGNPQHLNTDFSFFANNGYSIFTVEGRTNNGNLYFLSVPGPGVNNYSLHYGYRSSNQFTLAQHSNDANTPGGQPAPYTTQQFRLWNGNFDFANQTIWLDGTNVATRGNGTPFNPNMGPGVIGMGYNGGQHYQGDLAEILIYPRSVNTTERQQIEGYLRAKWFGVTPPALTDLLPNTSPLRIASGATLDLGGVSQTFASLNDHGIGGGTITNTIALPITLTFGGDNADASFSGPILDGAGSIALLKNGAGTQTLHGNGTYNGGIQITSGTLLINGLHSGTGFVLNLGGTLGGTGVIGGALASIGTTAPGTSPGTLTILGDYTESGTLAIELNSATTYDQILVGGEANLSGTLNVTTNGAYAPIGGNTFTLLTASNGVSGTFGTVNLPTLNDPNLGWDLQYGTNFVTLSVTSAPTGYAAYSNLHILALGPEGDDDADGFANLYEYVTGTSPTNGSSGNALAAARTNGLFALKFLRDTNSIDATLIVEGAYSPSNNTDWIGFATNLNGSWGSATNVIEDANQPANVTAYDIAPSATNRFLRLRITRP